MGQLDAPGCLYTGPRAPSPHFITEVKYAYLIQSLYDYAFLKLISFVYTNTQNKSYSYETNIYGVMKCLEFYEFCEFSGIWNNASTYFLLSIFCYNILSYINPFNSEYLPVNCIIIHP